MDVPLLRHLHKGGLCLSNDGPRYRNTFRPARGHGNVRCTTPLGADKTTRFERKVLWGSQDQEKTP
jgi:hypothetical protein